MLDSNIIKEIARDFCESAIEVTKMHMADCPDEYQTYAIARCCLQNAIKNAVESGMLDDLLNDFAQSVRREVAESDIDVENITIDSMGFVTAKHSFTKRISK